MELRLRNSLPLGPRHLAISCHQRCAAFALTFESNPRVTQSGSDGENVALYEQMLLSNDISPYPAEQIQILAAIPACRANNGKIRATDQDSPQYNSAAAVWFVPFAESRSIHSWTRASIFPLGTVRICRRFGGTCFFLLVQVTTMLRFLLI